MKGTGTILRADISLSPAGRSRGFGTLTFSTDDEALKAIDLFNNYEWQGRRIEVREDWAAGSKGLSGGANLSP
jgi:RNA recognition motif-containing protein